MHTCSFCKDPIPPFDKPRKAHLVIAKTNDDHIHTHGELDHKEAMQELIDEAILNIGLSSKAAGEVPKEIVFHNRQRIGDILMFTCGVRDFKNAFPNTRVNVASTCSHIWDHNPYIDRTLTPTDQNTIKIGPSKGTNQSNRIDWHFANAYRISIEGALKIHIPQGESRPDIWFTEEEYHAPRLFKDPYWVICLSGEKSWGCKMYPFDRWQEVVSQNQNLQFIQIGAREDKITPLQGSNVIDLIGKTQDKNTGIRDLFKLFLNAEGSIGLVSFHMHLSGALYKPCVVLAGAREPVSFTRYAYHQYLATDGTLPCSVPACWHCGIEKCTNLIQYPDKLEKQVPKCVDMIEPREVTEAIQRYYKGGRLIKGVPSEKPKLKNIVKTPVSIPASMLGGFDVKAKYGLDWGNGSIDPLDWPFIEDVIKRNQVKTVLEFGAGLSTLLISKHAQIVSYETDEVWLKQYEQAFVGKPAAFEIRIWDGWHMKDELGEFDLAFVDGPANGENRDEATRLAANHAKIVIVHDATRDNEIKWQKEYLEPGFQGPIKGGRWCHLWIKTPSFVKHPAPPPQIINPNRKHIKIVSTAKGWGGCSRSVTTIMKLFLKEGHSVEFIPFRNKVSSNEFNDVLRNGLMDVKVSLDYESIREPCDVLLCYADDFVWEFPKMAEHFSNLQAKRKIMMVNYRRGRIGEVSWTKGWDKYLFLNSGQEKDLLSVLPGVSTAVYPPCTDLSPFFDTKINYDLPLRIVRHNSQGDVKFDKEKTPNEILNVLESRKDVEIHMMPGPSFVNFSSFPNSNRFLKYPKNQPPIQKFLALGNLFWYSLPEGYLDMGPRVILEAMAAGLPILADPWGGALDRVTPETGWLVSKEEQIKIIQSITPDELKAKGEAARDRARKEFRPERWIELLTEEEVRT